MMIYFGLPDYINHNIRKNFINKKFCNLQHHYKILLRYFYRDLLAN